MTGIRMRNNGDAKYFAFDSYPERPPVAEAFLDNVQKFIPEFCNSNECKLDGVKAWCSFLVNNEGFMIPLLILEERADKSPKTLCSHCLVSGMQEFFVSKLRFHFIIQDSNKWTHPIEDDILVSKTHLFHGLIHGNGFGHLARIKRMTCGSRHLTGTKIMELWGRLCSSLEIRMISLMDISMKWEMSLPFLYGISNGKSWFQQWGYDPDDQQYTCSVENIRSLKLNSMESWQTTKLIQIAQKYGTDGSPVEDIGQLFACMLKKLHETSGSSSNNHSYPQFEDVALESPQLKKHSSDKIMELAEKVVELLVKESEQAGSVISLPRSELGISSSHQSVYNAILPRMCDTVVCGHLFSRKKMHSNTYYYSATKLNQDYAVELRSALRYLYDFVTTLNVVQNDTKVIWRSRLFLKRYIVTDSIIGNARSYICSYVPFDLALSEYDPGVHVFLPLNEKAGELKRMVEKAYRDTY